MKKILSLLTVITLVVSSSTSVISCKNTSTYSSVTKEQETNALQNFIYNAKKDNKLDPGFNISHGYFDKQSNFNNQKVFNNIQKINWTVTSSDNSTKDTLHNMLKASYSGVMDYNVKNKQFVLENHPFNKVNYTPGNFSTSLGTISMILGDSSDFTISVNDGQLRGLEYWLENTSIRAKNITNLFSHMGWGDYNKRTEFANLTLTDFKNLVDKPDLWNIPGGYMAIIHIKNLGTNKNKNYQVIWSNLKNSQDKTSLKLSRAHLSNTIWKNNSKENLWISKDLLTLMYQLKANINLNNFLIDKTSFFNWLNKTQKIYGNDLGIQTALNTNKDELWNCIQSLSLTSNQSKINNLIHENYKSYNLIFNQKNNEWNFDVKNSKGLIK